MSTLGLLETDFKAVTLDDLGESCTITLIAAQTFDASAGTYTDTLTAPTITGVIGV